MESNREDIYQKIIDGGLIGLIIFTPLPKGSIGVFYFSIMELVIFGLLLIWCIRGISGAGSKNTIVTDERASFGFTSLYIPILLLILFVVFQLYPLPSKNLKAFSPGTDRLYEELLPFYPNGETDNIKEDDPFSGGDEPFYTALPFISAPRTRRSLSLYGHSTREYLFKILAFAGLFFLIIETVRTRAQARRLIYVIIFTGLAIAVLSIINKYTYNGKALWIWKPLAPNAQPINGPFINRSHFASYVNLIIPIGIGMVFYEAERKIRGTEKKLSKLKLLLYTERGPRILIFFFASVVMIGALFLSLSRGGMLSFVVMLFFMSLMIATRRSIRKRFITVLLIFSVLGLTTWFGWDPIIKRMELLKNITQNPTSELRTQIWPQTFNTFKKYPLVGTGLGTFEYVFPMYKPAKSHFTFVYAENDYLQMLSEGGIIGAGIISWFLIIFFHKTVKRWITRHDRFIVYSVLGCLMGIVGFLLATITNFNFHLPANAFLFTTVAGLAFTLVHIKSGSRRSRRPELEATSAPLGKIYRYAVYPLLLGVFLVSFIQVAKIWAAEIYFNKANNEIKTPKLPGEGEFLYLNMAIDLNPINAEYRDTKALRQIVQIQKDPASPLRKQRIEQAQNGFKEAINLEPTNGFYWIHLGWIAGFQTGEYDLAEKAFENGVKLLPTNHEIHKQYALWAFFMARKTERSLKSRRSSASEVDKQTLEEYGQKYINLGVREYRAASALNPSLIQEALWRYSRFTQDNDRLAKIIPAGHDATLLIEDVVSRRRKKDK